MEEKLCPYCYKSIKGNYGSTEEDLICPHPNCRKIIPKVYLQYPVRHVISICNKTDLQDYSYEIGEYAKNETVEFMYSRIEYYTQQNNVQIILFEYLREEFSNSTETVVLAIHRCLWQENKGLPATDIDHADAVLINIDITDLKALYFNVGIERSPEEFAKWRPGKNGVFIREISEYFRKNQCSGKVAVLFANMQWLRNYPCVRDNVNYGELLEITREWISDYEDRKWIIESDKVIRRLLIELGEERMIKDTESLPDIKFFLYPSSKFRMVSNTYWMLAVLLWICSTVR